MSVNGDFFLFKKCKEVEDVEEGEVFEVECKFKIFFKME